MPNLVYFLNASQSEFTGPQKRCPWQVLTGRVGDPKFLKNWLTFAHSPYDADHIFDLRGLPRTGGAPSLMARPFPSYTQKLGDN